jgi:gliding motility-associated lipoprotein GldH
MRTGKDKGLFFCLLTIIVSIACSTNEVYYDYRSFRNSTWTEDSICMFKVPLADTLSLYDVYVELRNNDDYPYRNLWLFITLETPDGKARQDTLNCEMADEFGKWHGKGLSLYTLSLPYDISVQFPDSGTYTYSIRHGMREKNLKGISDVGLRIVLKAFDK